MLHAAGLGPLSYTDFDPRSEWLHGDEADTLLLEVPGFKKEQMKVLINTSGNIKISGERPLNDRRWIRFVKEFKIDKNCNPKAIQPKFDKDSGHLYILLPKQASQVGYANEIGTNPGKRVAAAREGDHGDDRAPAMVDDDVGRMHGSELGMGGRDSGTSRHKLFIINVAVAVMVLLGIGGYAVYRIWFAHGEKEN